MVDQAQSKIIEDNPIGKGLDAFRSSFNSICEEKGLFQSPDDLGRLSQEGKIDQRCWSIPLTGI
jgi:hypothetical protein